MVNECVLKTYPRRGLVLESAASAVILAINKIAKRAVFQLCVALHYHMDNLWYHCSGTQFRQIFHEDSSNIVDVDIADLESGVAGSTTRGSTGVNCMPLGRTMPSGMSY